MNSYGIYYTRKLTLLNDLNYASIPGNKEEYQTSCNNSTVNIYLLIHMMLLLI